MCCLPCLWRVTWSLPILADQRHRGPIAVPCIDDDANSGERCGILPTYLILNRRDYSACQNPTCHQSDM